MRQIVTVAHSAGTFHTDTEVDAAMKLLGKLNDVMKPIDENSEDVQEETMASVGKSDLFLVRYIVDMHAKRCGFDKEELENIHDVVENINAILKADTPADAPADAPAAPDQQ